MGNGKRVRFAELQRIGISGANRRDACSTGGTGGGGTGGGGTGETPVLRGEQAAGEQARRLFYGGNIFLFKINFVGRISEIS
ncbi:MAG: hypothetical protein SXA11_11380 [Cyanobacteriota bacterium]|nr:hypothetical protein [Cyanobacteriota bacterium]